MTGKRLEVIHELLPSTTKFAFLTDPANQTLGTLQTKNIQAAADFLGLSLLHVSAHTPDEIDNAFETAVRGGVGGMIVGADALFAGGASTVTRCDFPGGTASGSPLLAAPPATGRPPNHSPRLSLPPRTARA